MKLPLEVVFRDEIVPLPTLDEEIRRRAAKLEQWGGDLVSCRVVVEAAGGRHRQGHEYRLTVDVRVPEGHVVVSRHPRSDEAQIAVREAFDAMDRLLDERARQRRDGPRHSQPGETS
jgi:ribosome-associated translation inhibitor RaiA